MANGITAAGLQAEAAQLTLVDVRRVAARDASPEAIPGASWRDPERVGEWAADLPAGRRIVVYCVHGHEVSQGVADALVASGHEARYLDGGIVSWVAAGGPVTGKA